MKVSVLFLFLFFSLNLLARNYEIAQRSDPGGNYTLTIIKDGGKEVAKFCLIDPDGGFKFFSNKSSKNDSIFFSKPEKDFVNFSAVNKIGAPICAILADFNYKSDCQKGWNFNYFFNSIGVLLFAPSYFKAVDMLSPCKAAKRFFVEIKINKKDYYGLLVSSSDINSKEASEMIKCVKSMKNYEGTPVPILNFPLKLISFEGRRSRLIYESNKDHQSYTCMFLSGK